MKRFELLTSLPSVLSCIILQDWLDFKSVVALDSAYCCHSHRDMFLDLLESDQYFVREQVIIAHQSTIFHAVQKYGEKFRSVLFADRVSSAEGTLVVSHCRNLTHVRFGDYYTCTPELQNIAFQKVVWLDLSHAYRACYTLQLPQLCHCLRSAGLAGTDLTDHALSVITAACPHIVHIDIAKNRFLTDAGILHMVTNLKGLRGLSIEHNHILTDASLEHIYTHCAGTLDTLHMSCHKADYKLPQTSVFSAAAINNFLERCTQLRTLFLDKCSSWTGTSLPISPAAFKNISTLVLGSSSLIHPVNLCSIGKHCTNLHTLVIHNALFLFSTQDCKEFIREFGNLKELYHYVGGKNQFYDFTAMQYLKIAKPSLVVKRIRWWSEFSKYDVMNL